MDDDSESEEEEKVVIVKKDTKKVKKEESKDEMDTKPDDGVYKWWAQSDDTIQSILNSDQKWQTLKHNGVLFPPDYQPHSIPVYYDGKPVKLDPEQEEVATMYASMLESDYIQKKQFNENFWAAWKELLGKNHTIKSLAKCDFSKIWEHLLTEKETKLN